MHAGETHNTINESSQLLIMNRPCLTDHQAETQNARAAAEKNTSNAA